MKDVLFDGKFNFPGFHEEGVCNIRILQKKGEKPTVICSQLSSYYGTSITNAVERIAEELINKYWDYEKHQFDVEKRNNVSSIEVSMCQKILSTFKRKEKSKNNNWVEAMQEIVWVEHYQEGTGIGKSDTYVVVSFSDLGEPNWSRSVSIEELSDYTLFNQESFQFDRSKLSAL
ncbi:hypothetical protein [Vibrio aestuarianus]|uniref:hypothetical protein n=1 Tax=Vibrio aestuarianus TaxID=28171 RepID=UPI00237C7C69|nr:hypothetical protein [Vibrio aestuarianus]MDE1233236.1 hypothetical protein [Vibrio aestuarianus]